MTNLLSILISDIFPIFVIAGIGYLIESHHKGTARALSSVSFNVLSPCLAFTQLVTSTVNAEGAARMAAFCVLLTCLMGLVARAVATALKLEPRTGTSFLLTVMFSNSGNYALPVVLFAFGSAGLAYASVYFVTSAVVVYSLGVWIAASAGLHFRQAVLRLLKVPSLYALTAALIMVATHTHVPLAFMRPIGMLGDAAIPVMILVLGTQLQRATFPKRPSVVFIAAGLSLFLSPVIGTVLASVLGLTSIARDVAIVVSAMPAAVVTTVLALEFDLDSSLVTSVVFVSTVLSPLSLVMLIAYLKRL